MKESKERSSSLMAAEDLSKWYGEVIGLNSFNLEVSSGITGIVGPNGSGKSTFFKVATGIIKPSTGTLKIRGEDPWLNTELLSRIGFCPDYDNLADDSTGEEFLELVGGLHGMRGGSLKERISEVAEIVDMTGETRRKIGEYSKGMRQKIKLAGAILHDPDLLLLDEPLSGADPESRKSLINVIRSLSQELDHDIVVSSHVLYEIERMTSNVALIFKGRRIASGKISEIRGLIDEHPHNIIVEGERMTELAKRLMDGEYTTSVGFEGNRDRIKVQVSDPDKFFDSLPKLVVEEGCEIEQMYSLDEGLDAVFRYLTEE